MIFCLNVQQKQVLKSGVWNVHNIIVLAVISYTYRMCTHVNVAIYFLIRKVKNLNIKGWTWYGWLCKMSIVFIILWTWVLRSNVAEMLRHDRCVYTLWRLNVIIVMPIKYYIIQYYVMMKQLRLYKLCKLTFEVRRGVLYQVGRCRYV